MKIKSGNILVGFFALLIAFVAITGAWALFLSSKIDLEKEQIFNVKKGQGLSAIARSLEEEGVIHSPFFFKLSATMMFADKNLQAGSYKFNKDISIRDIIKMLARGHTVTYKVTIPEGLRTHEILAILKASPQISGDFNALNLTEENLLLPETYQYTHEEDVKQILLRMKEAMLLALDEAWENRDNNLPLRNKMELLTLASIIEKETGVDSERSEIAGVFVNRLNKRMRLQSDPTVIYGLKDYKGDITYKHLKTDHPYNTYTRRGLPKGPIAHPGVASLKAAANPNVTENIYFVAKGDGGHVFAKSHAEHKKNVAAYLKKYRKLVSGK